MNVGLPTSGYKAQKRQTLQTMERANRIARVPDIQHCSGIASCVRRASSAGGNNHA